MEIEKAILLRDNLQKRRLKDSPYLTRADLFYRLSVAANKEDTQALTEYASFLDFVREYDKAEQHYLQALTIDPNDTYCLRKYAAFLQDVRQNIDLAERFFARARGQVEQDASTHSTSSPPSAPSSLTNSGNDNNKFLVRTRGRSRSEDATGVEQQETRF